VYNTFRADGAVPATGFGTFLLRQSSADPKDLSEAATLDGYGTAVHDEGAVPCRRRSLPSPCSASSLVEQLSVALVVTGDNNNVRTVQIA